jgi:hypothetical protein
MSTRLYVGNLSFNTSTETVRAAFEEFGAVSDVHLVSDRETGRPRGFGFVTMGTPEEAKKAIEGMDGQMLDGTSSPSSAPSTASCARSTACRSRSRRAARSVSSVNRAAARA